MVDRLLADLASPTTSNPGVAPTTAVAADRNGA